MILGLDIHGVIDADFNLFKELTQKLLSNLFIENEIHIITGIAWKPKVSTSLMENGICWTKSFSITDFHVSIGTDIKWKDEDHPLIDEVLWDKTKALYCKKNNIDIHIDDSDVYGKYFRNIDTQYIKFNPKIKELLNTILL